MLLWASPAPLPSRHRGFFFGRLQPELLPATMGCPQTTRSHRTLGPRMYKTIMVPVDLSHRERLEKAVATAADLSKCYKVPAELVAVTATAARTSVVKGKWVVSRFNIRGVRDH